MIIEANGIAFSALAVSGVSIAAEEEAHPVKIKKRKLFRVFEETVMKKIVAYKLTITYYDEFFICLSSYIKNPDRSVLEEIRKNIVAAGCMIGDEKFMSRPDYGKLMDEIQKRNAHTKIG